MRVREIDKGKVAGIWRDAEGNDNVVSFKEKWGTHVFSKEELEDLLEGKSITFAYNGGDITGHLQYNEYNQNLSLGFCTDFDDDYKAHPIFDPSVGSQYEKDRRNEFLMNRFMRLHYYSKLLNADKTDVQKEFINDVVRQRQGIDVIYFYNGKKYIVDEKAQMDYIFRDKGPLDTFALELWYSSGKGGKIGWFINDELETEYYMFIWPHADAQYTDRQLRSVDDIEYASYALVERNRLKEKIEAQYMVAKCLGEYAVKLSEGKLEGVSEEYNKRYFKKTPFDVNGYLVYSEAKKEKPVNLVVRKTLIEEIAEEKGILKRDDEA